MAQIYFIRCNNHAISHLSSTLTHVKVITTTLDWSIPGAEYHMVICNDRIFVDIEPHRRLAVFVVLVGEVIGFHSNRSASEHNKLPVIFDMRNHGKMCII